MTTSTARDPTLAVYQDEPFNAGTPLALLRRSFITLKALFYARNHAAIPCGECVIDIKQHRREASLPCFRATRTMRYPVGSV